jgi:hypothetical protein
VVPEMILQVVFILRDEDTLGAEEKFLWLDMS